MNLTNQFLIAMPGMGDGNFAGTVVYMCEHNDKGALGLVINRPIDINLKNLFEKVDLTLDRQDLASTPVYFGGPVQTERGFVLLHRQPRLQVLFVREVFAGHVAGVAAIGNFANGIDAEERDARAARIAANFIRGDQAIAGERVVRR